MDAGEQLGRRERLDQVVVRPAFQALHPVLDCITRSQHQHQRLIARTPQVFEHAQPVHARHHPVQHDHVGPVGLNLSERLGAVARAEDVEALVGQRASQHLQELGIIVDDQNGCHTASYTMRYKSVHYSTLVQRVPRCLSFAAPSLVRRSASFDSTPTARK